VRAAVAAGAAVVVVLLCVVAGVAAAGSSSSEPPGYRFAVSLASAGPRPAGSVAERRAHSRVERVFRSASLRVAFDRFAVPGRGRSRNVIGIFDTPASCLYVLMAHADSMPGTVGAQDNASGVGVVASLASRLRVVAPRCDVWLVATGAEERLFTGRPDHLGALALVRRVRRMGRARDLRMALSLDEVGRGSRMVLRSSAPSPRAGVERAVLRAASGTGLRVSWAPDGGTGNSDHREFQLAGLPAAKLGVVANPCRHEACDRPSRLTASTFLRARRLVEALVG
jgi:hypothetical protein